MKQAVAYYRVSTKKQNDLRQEYSVKEYYSHEGFEIVEIFRETISGAKKNKPELQKALEYIDQHNIKYLVASELTRIGRTNEVNTIIDELTEKGVCVCLQKENLKTLNEDFTLNDKTDDYIGFLVMMAKNELKTFRYRSIDGRRNAVLNAHHYSGGGRGIYGYDVREKKIFINEEEAKVVLDIFTQYLHGWGTVRIANNLNNQNIPTKLNSLHQKQEVKFTEPEKFIATKWGRSQVLQILQNKIYTGERKFKNETFRQVGLRIIDDDIFNMVQIRKAEKRQSNGEYNLKKKYTYLLGNKILKCGVCNRIYSGVQVRNIYICCQNKYSKLCENDNLNLAKFDQFIKEFLINNYKNLMFDNESIRANIKKHKAEKEQTENKEVDLKKLRKKQELKYDNGIIEMDELKKNAFAIDDQIDSLEQNILKLSELISINQMQLFENTLAIVNLNKNYSAGEIIIDNSTIQRLIKEIRVFKRDREGNRNIKIIMINNDEHNLIFEK
jgi:DNA invertase Pin-like site-specific DNA recombinase